MASDFTSLLAKVQQSSSEQDRIWALHTLMIYFPKEAFPKFLEYLKQPNSTQIYRSLLEYLIEIIKPGLNDSQINELITEFQFTSLIQNPDWKIRKLCIELTQWIRNQEWTPFLLKCLEDNDASVRLAALRAIQFFGEVHLPNIIQMLNDVNEEVINEALNLVRKFNLQIPPLLRQRFKHSNSLKLRVNYATTIFYFAEQNPQKYRNEVYQYLTDDLTFLQGNAIEILAKIRDGRILSVLVDKLNHSEEHIVIKSLSAISILQERSLIPHVLEKLNDNRRPIRKMAVECIGSFRDHAFLPDLFPLLFDNFIEIRLEVYLILKSLPDPRAIIPLLDRLHTAPLQEHEEIVGIFDFFSFEDLVIPFAREYRNNPRFHSYIAQRLNEKIPDVSLLNKLSNLSIPTLLDALDDSHLWETSSKVILGWGFRVIQPLQIKLEHLMQQLKTNTESSIQEKSNIRNPIEEIKIRINRIKTILTSIDQQYRIKTEQNFSLLL